MAEPVAVRVDDGPEAAFAALAGDTVEGKVDAALEASK